MNNFSDANPEQDAALMQAAETVVSNALGRAIRFTEMKRLTEPDRRNAIYRCFTAPESRASGEEPDGTLIIKQVTGQAASSETPNEWEQKRFFNDWAGAEFLSALPSDMPISPRYYGGSVQGGFFILEDLGEHHSLVEPLLHGDAARAETALLKYITCLGKMHALTAGKAEAYEALFESKLPGSKPFAYELNGLEPRMTHVQHLLEQWGVPTSSATTAEIQAVSEAVLRPGPFLTYIHSDPCPDNVFDLDDGFRLIDFEASHFGHALLDAIYPRMLFPSCWCANRLPGALVERLEHRYREELIHGCPQAQEDALWETALVSLCALSTLNTLAYELEDAINKDHEWGISTIRPRILARLEAFIETAELFHGLPALRGAVSRLLPLLQARWAETTPLPLYPAFQPSL